jgi:hypothetical protein
MAVFVCGKSLLVLFTSLLPFMERSTIEDFPYNITELIGNSWNTSYMVYKKYLETILEG